MAGAQPADEGTSGVEPRIGEIPRTLTHGGRFTQYNFRGHIFEVTSKYKSLKPLGQGAFGLVCSALDTVTNVKVAIKKIHNAFDNKANAKRALREIKLLRHMNHENIIALRDVIPPPERESFNDVYIVYEFMDTDLQVMESKQPLPQSHIQLFLYYILRGLKYMHSANVLHRDLKPGNILVNGNCDLKICDFGMARVKSDSMTPNVVTRWYQAPEILLKSSDYTAAIDVWAVGCIFAELLQGKALFQGRSAANQLLLQLELLGTPSEAELSHLNEDAKKFMRRLRVFPGRLFAEKFGKVDLLVVHLIENMLRFVPGQRITAEEALAHPYFYRLRQQLGLQEPTCAAPFDFAFERDVLTEEQFKDLVYQECLVFNPEHRAT